MKIGLKNGTLIEYLSVIPDHREEKKVKHKLADILFIAVCATICGADGWEDFEYFGLIRLDWLQGKLDMPHGVPSEDTFRRVISALEPTLFQECVTKWLTSFVEDCGEHIAIDGKTARRSFDRATGKNALHLVSAWATETSLLLGQVRVEDKSNEIKAIPELLKMLDLKGRLVTIDAMGCQKEIAGQINEKGGDYVLALKGNQPNLHEDIKYFFDEAEKDNFDKVTKTVFEETDFGHGRIETRTCCAVSDVFWIPGRENWPGLKSIARVKTKTITKQSGEERTDERFYISSLPGDAKKIGEKVRSHWGIENSLHWVLDVSFNEDASRIRRDHGAENLSFLRKLAIKMVKKANEGMKEKKSIRQWRKHAGWDFDFFVKVFFAGGD
jgi:predicted transposase YbfD/YdcC